MNEETQENKASELTKTNPPKQQKKQDSFWEIIKFTIIALVIVIPLRVWIAQPFVVHGGSMDNTLHSGDYLIIDEISYRFSEPRRGDVVVFRPPQDSTRFYVKRIIGLPGETVKIQNGDVTIISETYPDGWLLDEPYILSTTPGLINKELGEDEYFMMGDNRTASSDSRIWGPLDGDAIIGRALVRLFPLGDIALKPGKHVFEN